MTAEPTVQDTSPLDQKDSGRRGLEADAAARDATECRMPGGGGPSPRPHGGGGTDLFQRDFLQGLGVLDKRIAEHDAKTARDTSGDNLTYGQMLSAEQRRHFIEQDQEEFIEQCVSLEESIERGASFTPPCGPSTNSQSWA